MTLESKRANMKLRLGSDQVRIPDCCGRRIVIFSLNIAFKKGRYEKLMEDNTINNQHSCIFQASSLVKKIHNTTSFFW
jgi:hypothetical protein